MAFSDEHETVASLSEDRDDARALAGYRYDEMERLRRDRDKWRARAKHERERGNSMLSRALKAESQMRYWLKESIQLRRQVDQINQKERP